MQDFQRVDKMYSCRWFLLTCLAARTFSLGKFVCSVPQITYAGEDSYKCKVMPSHLKNLFGKYWHICIYTKSSTQCRIIGLISLHFRKKSPKICDKVHTVR